MWKNFVIDLADFGTQTEKGCPSLTYREAFPISIIGNLLSPNGFHSAIAF